VADVYLHKRGFRLGQFGRDVWRYSTSHGCKVLGIGIHIKTSLSRALKRKRKKAILGALQMLTDLNL
jgi:hypothetical protein